ncbi:MAG: PAS domain S-box protein, partial [Desulfobacteraceae bacterium]|nr:PAS domain S-box protein [Desulfobacteraceae bacterium]
RIKELNCLYSISNLLENQDISIEELFHKAVNLMPPSWQYPEITCARIVFESQEYRSENFKKSIWEQSTNILVDGNKKGTLQTYYFKEMPKANEGPFLKEERDLINEIAERIGRFIERKQANEKRHKAEEELQESEEKYRSMMESMDEAVYICSSGFHIEYMNPAMIKRTGYDAIDKPCHKVMHELDAQCPWCVFEKVSLGESISYEIVSPKDNRTYIISNSPIFHNDGTISKLTMLRDITEIKILEHSLLQSQKMESIGTLAGGIAHDFNNILFPIVGHSEMLMEDVPVDSPFQEG